MAEKKSRQKQFTRISNKKHDDKKIRILRILLCLGLVAILSRVFYLQVVASSHLKDVASQQRKASVDVIPKRGTIYDRDGEVLAISEDAFTVYATPYLVREPEKAARKISRILGVVSDDIEEKLKSDSGFVYIARKIDRYTGKKIEKLNIPGIGLMEESKRFYPMGKIGSQLIGLVDIDNRGQSGLELYYEDILGGRPGKIFFEKDAAGSPIPGTERQKVSRLDGSDIKLTIDRDIQAKLEESIASAMIRYKAKSASALVMDCNNGDIIAMGSVPTFDPNNRENLRPEWTRNRCVTDVFEPGSALKILTAAAALEEKIVEPGTPLYVPSRLTVADKVFTDAEIKPSRQLSFADVIAQSSNVGTIRVALQLGKDKLFEYIKKFGLGSRTGIDFPGEVEGIVLDKSKWSGTSVATISIGQGISITAAQLACLAAAIANGGRRVYPHILKARSSGKKMIDADIGGLGDQIISEQTSKKLTGIMVGVTSPKGTGQKAAINYYTTAGKTGTAAKPLPGGKGYSGYVSTFVGFAPAENPKLVCVVFLDEPVPIWGGETAAPVFREIMEFSLQHLRIPPSWSASR